MRMFFIWDALLACFSQSYLCGLAQIFLNLSLILGVLGIN